MCYCKNRPDKVVDNEVLYRKVSTVFFCESPFSGYRRHFRCERFVSYIIYTQVSRCERNLKYSYESEQMSKSQTFFQDQ